MTDRIEELLNANDFCICGKAVQDGKTYAEVEFALPLGEDVIETIWYDGTEEGFIAAFRENAENFDPDDHAAMWIDGRGKNGTPSSITDLIEDAKAIKKMLVEMALILDDKTPTKNLDDKAEEVLRLYRNTPAGKITDADTILADILEDTNHYVNGIGEEIISIWCRHTDERRGIEELFYAFTDVDFGTYLDRCIQQTTRPETEAK